MSVKSQAMKEDQQVATEFLEASEEEGRRAEREKELARQKELEQAQELAEARERSARNMKRFAAVVGVVAIIALGAMVFAVKQQKVAETAQKTAIAARSVAETAKETLRKEFINSAIKETASGTYKVLYRLNDLIERSLFVY